MQNNFDKTAEILATFFGAGRFPKAPGTAGSFAAIPLYCLLRLAGPRVYWGAVAIITAVGTFVSGIMEQRLGQDPGCVVIDEVAGVLVTLCRRPANFKTVLAGVLIFRFFDILKPAPVGTLDENLPGGPGIMADDLAAGVMALGVLELLRCTGLLK